MAGFRGALIAVEGIDGAGTTTQCQRLVTWLEAEGRGALLTREPSTGPIGTLLRAVLRGEHAPVDRGAVALLFAADRLDHMAREVAPAVAAGQVVVSDRYVLSSLAYQSIDLPRSFVEAINTRAPTADLTILVEVPVEIAVSRRRARGGADELFDGIDFQRRVAAHYRVEAEALRAAGQKVAFVDGTPPAEEVFAAIREAARETCFPPGSTPS